MELRDGVVWDGSVALAALEPSTRPGAPASATAIRLLTAPWLGIDAAAALIAALTEDPATAVRILDVGDELVRTAARRAGWTGELRAVLHAPAGTPGTPGPTSPTEVVTAVGALLPTTEVTRPGLRRRLLSLRARTDDGLRLSLKIADRADVVPELLAAAFDTAFSIRRRFGRMASGVHTISIDDGAGTFDDHSTLGSAQSGTGTFFLDTSLACADAFDAQRQRMGGQPGISARPPRPWFTIDGVVAHEYWHNLDTTLVASPSTYVEVNRGLGAELGVETFEHALRGREPSAPAEWQRAFRRVVDEVSPYATTNMREATAELFKLWWCADPGGNGSPLVARFGRLLDHFYPPPA